MSGLKTKLTKRGRILLVASSLVLIGTLVAAPSAGAASKTFIFTVSPTSVSANTADQTFNVTVTNKTANASINSFSVTLPTEFIVLASPAPTISSSNNGDNSGAIFSTNTSANTASVQFLAPIGSNKFVTLRIHASVNATTCGTTTSGAWTVSPWTGSQVGSGQPFTTSQSAVTTQITQLCLANGGSVTDPVTGQTETISGDFTGHVNVSFGGDTANCSFDPTYGAQWAQYHLATQVQITPASDFHAGTQPKVSTSEFNQSISGGDSSWYLICYAVPKDDAHPTAFATKGGLATDRTINDTHYWVGILASCDDAPAPCVSEQFLTTGPGSPPWTVSQEKVHISIEMPPNDPYKK